MCGIAGIFSANGLRQDHVTSLQSANRIAEHRGPDGQGFAFFDLSQAGQYKVLLNTDKMPTEKEVKGMKLGLAHRRLAILDLSSSGLQPMSNENGMIWIIFNGEIYNYSELRGELIKAGHVFKSRTDTEVLVHAYEEWGDKLVNQLNGMWAFALVDIKKKYLYQ